MNTKTSMTRIRKAAIEDLATVQQLGFELLDYERKRWDEALDPQWPFTDAGKATYEKAIRERIVLLVEIDDRVAGFLIGAVIPANPNAARKITTANLANIFVREQYRGQGTGVALMEEFKHICKEANVTKMNVTVNSANEQAIAFYTKGGFAPSRMIMAMDLE